MQRAKSEYAIQTVSNALRLLEAFEGEGELGVSELARRLNLHKNNVFRLLATLEEKGYVEQKENGCYQLGNRCLQLGHSFSRARVLMRLTRPVLERLARETGETAHLGVLRDFEVVHLDGEQSQALVVTALRDKLIEHLRRVAAQGWAVDLEESGRGLVCAAAPVHADRMLAALSVSGPAFRLDRDELEGRIVPAVVHAANGLSRQLGSAL